MQNARSLLFWLEDSIIGAATLRAPHILFMDEADTLGVVLFRLASMRAIQSAFFFALCGLEKHSDEG